MTRAEKDTVSIIVPVFNVGQYLSKCLDSICKQTYTLLDVIVVDDGSTDESSQICESFRGKDSRFRIVHQENKGLSAARNRGLDLVKGTWVMFVDGDDFLHPNTVERLLHGIRSGADMSMIRFTRVDGSEAHDTMGSVEVNGSDSRILSGQQCLEALIAGKESHEMGFVWNKMYPARELSGLRFYDIYSMEESFQYRNRLYGTAFNREGRRILRQNFADYSAEFLFSPVIPIKEKIAILYF